MGMLLATRAVSMLFRGHTASPLVSAQQWRSGKGVRLAVCESTAAEAGLECTHRSGHQTRGSRLVFGSGAAAEDWHGCPCCSQAPVGARAGESREGFTQPCGESWGSLWGVCDDHAGFGLFSCRDC